MSSQSTSQQVSAAPTSGSKPLVRIIGVYHGCAVIQIDNPPVNSLSPAVMQQLDACYDQAAADSSVKAAVITGSGKFFMAGADIQHLQKMQQDSNPQSVAQFGARGHGVFNKIESGKLPTVAAVNGVALGGGLELAMACNARVAFKVGKFGLPELKLGIIPGLGGTQRLPRLIGVKSAVGLMLSSRSLPAKAALKAGLVDRLVKKPKDLIPTAVKTALGIAAGKLPRRRSLYLTDKLNPGKDKVALLVAGAKAERVKGVPHPAACLRAVSVGLRKGGEAGIEAEMDEFGKLVLSPTAKALIHFFFSSKASAKVPGLSKQAKGAKIRTAAVIGGGTMGAGIVLLLLMKGYRVILKEINETALEGAVARIIGLIKRALKRKKGVPVGPATEMMLRHLVPTTSYEPFKTADVVIEAVIESLPLKQKIFADLVKYTREDCILATNTSTIDVADIGAKIPDALPRIIGLHFFSPAHIMPLLEIVRTKHTNDATIKASLQLSKRIGKTPVVVGNCVGFTANRIFFPYGQAASLLVDCGLSPYDIDAALEAWGMPMGVFRMCDLSGVDVFQHVGAMIQSAYGERTYQTAVGKYLSESKRLGQKSGKGYYVYDRRGKHTQDAKGIESVLQASRGEAKGQVPGSIPPLTAQDIVECVLFPVVNESYRVLAEKHVIRSSDIDVAAVFGYGFPAWRGGVMYWAQSQGLAYVRDRLHYFASVFGASNSQLARFFTPCKALSEAADQ